MSNNPYPYTSDFIFSLAEKYDISLTDKEAEISDESLNGFYLEYEKACLQRDAALTHHLKNTPNLFRTFLPWRARVFHTIFQLQWYYDEMIVFDPIYLQIKQTTNDHPESKKKKLRELLIFLTHFKESILHGFILFGSYESLMAAKTLLPDVNYPSLIADPSIRQECDRLVQAYKMEDQWEPDPNSYSIRAYYRGKQALIPVIKDMSLLKPNEEGMYGFQFNLVGSSYIPLSLEEIQKDGLYEKVFSGFVQDYEQEIQEVVDYLSLGIPLNTPVLFDRKIDQLIMSSVLPAKNGKATTDYSKLALPFVDGIPPEKLIDIRLRMPEAFKDFRNLLFEIIYDLQQTEMATEVLSLKIEQRINPLLKKLDAEIQSSLLKAKILGIGLPLVSGVGALGLWHFGVDITKIASVLYGGVGLTAEATIIADYLTKKKNMQADSLYYLWKVKEK